MGRCFSPSSAGRPAGYFIGAIFYPPPSPHVPDRSQFGTPPQQRAVAAACKLQTRCQSGAHQLSIWRGGGAGESVGGRGEFGIWSRNNELTGRPSRMRHFHRNMSGAALVSSFSLWPSSLPLAAAPQMMAPFWALDLQRPGNTG